MDAAAPGEDTLIRRMSDTLASQVAAGEVVERPASVVKELVENSIDAGARAVRVEIRRGGISLIRVSDDGSGMSRADAELCLQRHATSKLLSAADLFDIRHLGFRGEALPSIASVSRLILTTRRPQDISGSRVICEGGEQQPPTDAGCAPGTDISIADLFYNTPVRRKFLKSEETESGHAEHQVKLHALAFPGVRFTLVRDGSTLFDLPATQDLRERIAGLFGREAADTLLRIRPTEAPGLRITGFLMPLSAARRNRRMQFFFLNGRPIDSLLVARAVRDGYGGFPTGLHPALFLYLEVDPALVDVNVHPAKREVRFRRESELSLAVMDAVAGTLAAHARGGSAAESEVPPTPQPEPQTTAPTEPTTAPTDPSPASATTAATAPPTVPTANTTPPPAPGAAQRIPLVLRPVLEPQQRELKLPPASPRPAAPTGTATPASAAAAPPLSPLPAAAPDPALRRFRDLGLLHGRYCLFENTEGLVLMSPRAARERIIFERLMQSNRHPLTAQRLLSPELLEIDPRDRGIVSEVREQLQHAGYIVSEFGHNTLRIEAVPAILPLQQAAPFLSELLSAFTSGEVRLTRAKDKNPFELLALRLARLYAIREDISPWLREPLRLLSELLRCEIPYCTPHGRPTLLPFALSEIERRFHAR
ncbi:MAG: DNA mismatch repair endonuclease MutL [Akkermansia sp.]